MGNTAKKKPEDESNPVVTIASPISNSPVSTFFQVRENVRQRTAANPEPTEGPLNGVGFEAEQPEEAQGLISTAQLVPLQEETLNGAEENLLADEGSLEEESKRIRKSTEDFLAESARSHEETRRMCEETDRLCEKTDRLCEKTRRLCEETRQMREETRQMREETRQTREEAARWNNEMEQRLKECKRDRERQDRLLEELRKQIEEESNRRTSAGRYDAAKVCSRQRRAHILARTVKKSSQRQIQAQRAKKGSENEKRCAVYDLLSQRSARSQSLPLFCETLPSVCANPKAQTSIYSFFLLILKHLSYFFSNLLLKISKNKKTFPKAQPTHLFEKSKNSTFRGGERKKQDKEVKIQNRLAS